MATIRLLGAKCNFTDLKRELRERLVLGMRGLGLVVVSGRGLLERNWFQTLGLQILDLCWSAEQVSPYKEEYPGFTKDQKFRQMFSQI